MALKTIRTASMVHARTETENGIYDVTYQWEEYQNQKTLIKIHLEISEKQEGEMTVNIGNMDYQGDHVSMNNFPYTEKTSIYLQEFSAIIEEVKLLIK